jgi:hypothetical protein
MPSRLSWRGQRASLFALDLTGFSGHSREGESFAETGHNVDAYISLQQEAVLIDNQPIGAPLNRNLGSPVAPGEAVEAELDRLITRRHDARVSFARTPLGVYEDQS